MIDFTSGIYFKLLQKILDRRFQFLPFSKYLTNPNLNSSNLLLRHDVDRVPQNSLNFAKLENSLGICGSYYFRIVPESYNLEIMHQIAALGHEIGYHYEDVDLVSQKANVKSEKLAKDALIDLAYESFCKKLELFRQNFEIKTICMHGSPRSKYDNKLIWQKYNYKDLGIIGEPYYDIDFNEFAYFTDTGRRWNGHKYSIRDKVNSKYNFDFKSTQDIINNIDALPNKVMFTIHPERWHDKPLPWLKEYFWQNTKNLVKAAIIYNNK